MRLSIKYKLFFIILSAHALVYVAIFSVGYYNFNRGFLDYVSRIEERQVPAMLKGLEDFYLVNGSWDRLRNDTELWLNLFRGSIENSTDPELIAARQRENSRPGPGGFTPNDWYYTSEYSPARPYLHLLDASSNIVRGTPGAFSPDLATLNPIVVAGTTVGFLAVTSRQQLSEQADVLFAEQQQNDFFLLTLVLGAISALIAFPAATILTRPVREVVAGTRVLTTGDYTSRIAVRGSDELSQLSEDFNTLAKTLSQNQTARQQWIADISHELRTPLAILRGELEAVQDGIRPLNAQTLDSLHHEVVHLTTLVNDLHELSLSDVGALVYKKEPLDLVEILEICVDQHRSLALKQQLQLKLEPAAAAADKVLAVMGDPDRLLQLFDNLLQNSCRYTHNGGEVRVQAHEQGDLIIVQWFDSAPGVSDKDIDHLFDRLYRVEMSRNRAKGGSGLGLAICQNIVKAHDGTITACHSPLGGLQLTIAFPRYPHKLI
jgi:two-component system, OmpR family, sensor histidine kinase BaeS